LDDDDEKFCFACPKNCFCNGAVWHCKLFINTNVAVSLTLKPIALRLTQADLMHNFPQNIIFRLEMLDLKDNGIKTLPLSLQTLQHLRFLDISYNNLTKLEMNSFTFSKKIFSINFDGNCLNNTTMMLSKDSAKFQV